MSNTDNTLAPDGSPQPTPPGRHSSRGCLIAAAVVLVIGFALLGGVYVAEVPFTLVLGWGFYLFRVLPELSVSGEGTATFVFTLALFAAGVHVAAQWWLQRGRPDEEAPPWTPGQTARLVCLVCLAFAAAIGITGVVHQTGWLLNSPEPILDRGESPFERSKVKNRMLQLGLAIHNYLDEYGHFPNGIVQPNGRPSHSWQTCILPFMEMPQIYSRIDLDRDWRDPSQRDVFLMTIPNFLCPTIYGQNHTEEGYAASHYAANCQVINVDRLFKLEDITDGTSNTVLAGEVATNFRAWGDPLNVRDPALGINQHADGFGAQWEGGMHFLFADGSMTFVSENIDPAVLRALSTPNAGDGGGGF